MGAPYHVDTAWNGVKCIWEKWHVGRGGVLENAGEDKILDPAQPGPSR